MAAFEKVWQEKGVSKGQVGKELIVEALVARGHLQEVHLEAVRNKQLGLYIEPHGNAGDELLGRSGRYTEREEVQMSVADKARQKRAARRRRMAR